MAGDGRLLRAVDRQECQGVLPADSPECLECVQQLTTTVCEFPAYFAPLLLRVTIMYGAARERVRNTNGTAASEGRGGTGGIGGVGGCGDSGGSGGSGDGGGGGGGVGGGDRRESRENKNTTSSDQEKHPREEEQERLDRLARAVPKPFMCAGCDRLANALTPSVSLSCTHPSLQEEASWKAQVEREGVAQGTRGEDGEGQGSESEKYAAIFAATAANAAAYYATVKARQAKEAEDEDREAGMEGSRAYFRKRDFIDLWSTRLFGRSHREQLCNLLCPHGDTEDGANNGRSTASSASIAPGRGDGGDVDGGGDDNDGSGGGVRGGIRGRSLGRSLGGGRGTARGRSAAGRRRRVCDMSLRVLLEGLIDWHYELRQLAQAPPEVTWVTWVGGTSFVWGVGVLKRLLRHT